MVAAMHVLPEHSDTKLPGTAYMLKHLRTLGYDDVPKSTPTGNKYLTNERYVLSLAKEAGMTPAQYDLHIWTKYSVKSTPNATRS